ncbi:hypothetical protein [Halorussus marinus]|uniref:hypothetical protein n=1 Tax=Halorussus marinus TaxID=2505976 RepID=UPI00106E144C|nr:hypothetical protein [Halorussus marinus]
MDWITLLVIGLFALAWLITLYQSWTEDWTVSRTVGMLVFLSGASIGVFYHNFLSTESSLLPWIEPIAAVIMLVGIVIAFWKPSGDNRSAELR